MFYFDKFVVCHRFSMPGGDVDVESLMKLFEPDGSSCATPRTPRKEPPEPSEVRSAIRRERSLKKRSRRVKRDDEMMMK